VTARRRRVTWRTHIPLLGIRLPAEHAAILRSAGPVRVAARMAALMASGRLAASAVVRSGADLLHVAKGE
jgi:hypothetical protein